MATIRHSFGIISIVVLYFLASRIGSTDSYQHHSQTFKNRNRLILFQIRIRQDGPSLESSSYLRYLVPWDSWTLGLLDLFPAPPYPHTYPYLHLPLDLKVVTSKL